MIADDGNDEERNTEPNEPASTDGRLREYILPWRWGTGTGRTRGDKDGEMGMDGRRTCDDAEERDESAGRGEGIDMGEMSGGWGCVGCNNGTMS